MAVQSEGGNVNRLLLVDGHGYAYRSFYAIAVLKAPDGCPTNAVFGFIKMLERARSLAQPTHIAVVWDGGLDQGRLESLPEYKGQRPEMPDDLEVQLDEIVAYLEASGIRSVCEEGVEADDLIGTVARRAAEALWQVLIATSDKDFMQLVSDRVQLLNQADKTQPLWGEGRVVEKTGVRPSQVVDWLSLVGDSVDNIRGVAGVGPKTAAKLLSQFGTVSGIYESLDRLPQERLRTALRDGKEAVLRNRALVELRTDVKSAPSLDQCALGQEDRDRLRQLFEAWGFRSLAARYADGPGDSGLLL